MLIEVFIRLSIRVMISQIIKNLISFHGMSVSFHGIMVTLLEFFEGDVFRRFFLKSTSNLF